MKASLHFGMANNIIKTYLQTSIQHNYSNHTIYRTAGTAQVWTLTLIQEGMNELTEGIFTDTPRKHEAVTIFILKSKADSNMVSVISLQQISRHPSAPLLGIKSDDGPLESTDLWNSGSCSSRFNVSTTNVFISAATNPPSKQSGNQSINQ